MRGLVILVVLLGLLLWADAGCLGRCCRGTDLACNSTDWRMDRRFGTCFCDEACRRTRDCCFDYPSACPAQPCLVSPWSHWSGCAQPCKAAFRERRRHVQREPSNGEVCPPLVERAGCLEYLDNQGQSCALDRGPALITSAGYSRGRSQGDTHRELANRSYCVEFKVVSLSPYCTAEGQHHTRWTRYLSEGYKVCVECEPTAMHKPGYSCQGDGATSGRDELLQWQAVGNSHCRGTWTRVRRLDSCTCLEVHHLIFV